MAMSIVATICLVLSGVTTVLARNPAIAGLYADPNIAVFDGTYYVYSTTDGFPGWSGQTFYVWHSTDLVTWTRTPDPILTLSGTSGNVPWAGGNAWAPAIIERGGTYYFYFCGWNEDPSLNKRMTIGVASASSPLGPFKAQAKAMITNDEPIHAGQAIDPAAFIDPKTGKYYLFWGNSSPMMAELADDMISLKPNTFKKIDGLTDFTEASFVVYRKPYYHLTYSIGSTNEANYRVGYATAEDINGPWTYRGIILQQDASKGILATGSSSSVNVPGTDDWYIAYHRFKIPGGDGSHREICLDNLSFDEQTGLITKVQPTLEGVHWLGNDFSRVYQNRDHTSG